jgi:hypothetical protein
LYMYHIVTELEARGMSRVRLSHTPTRGRARRACGSSFQAPARAMA